MTCACSVFSSTKSPDVLVTSFFLKDATLLETTAEFGIRIENDNPFPVEIDGSIHRVYLNDVFLGKGRDTSSFTIPRLGTLDRQISINVRNLTLIRKFEEIIHKPNIRYEIRSTFYRKNSIYGISSENKGEIRLNSYLQDMNAGRKTRPFHLAPNNR
jgi:LEA14-like dessication related protein